MHAHQAIALSLGTIFIRDDILEQRPVGHPGRYHAEEVRFGERLRINTNEG